jgi:uncharacterized protein (DUF488 family)
MRIYTIGHSTRSFEELIALLREHGVTRLADIRRFPGSRRYPHFSRESLETSLPHKGIEYVHFEDLGGRRKPAPDSPNTYWTNDQFRAYADYLATPELAAAVDRLLRGAAPASGASNERTAAEAAAAPLTAVMCAEAVPWRCHRNLLSDELVRRGVDVTHIIGSGASKPHVMNDHARVEDGHLVYGADQKGLDFRGV